MLECLKDSDKSFNLGRSVDDTIREMPTPMAGLKSRAVAEAQQRGVAFRVLARTLSGPRANATSFVYHNRHALSRTTPINVAHSMGLERAQGSRS